MNDEQIKQELENVKRAEGSIGSALNKMRSEQNETKGKSVSMTLITKLASNIVPFILYVIFLIFAIKYIGIYGGIEYLVNLIFKLSFIIPEQNLFLGYTLQMLIELIAGYVTLGLYAILYVLLPIKFIFYHNSDKVSFEDNWPDKAIKLFISMLFVFIAITMLLYVISANFGSDGQNPNPIDVIDEQTTKASESYSWCVLKNVANPTACMDLLSKEKAVESERTKYSLQLVPPLRKTYDIEEMKKNPIPITYEYLTQNGELILKKFECYIGDTKGKPIDIDDSIANQIIKTGKNSKKLLLECELGDYQMDSEKDTNFKIIPVLYYTIKSDITQEIPIISIPADTTTDELYILEDKYLSAFKSVPAVISTKILDVKTLWTPQPPVFYNNGKDTEYRIEIEIKKNTALDSSQFGSIQSSKITDIYIPKVLDYNCGDENLECKPELVTVPTSSDQQSYLTIKFKINQEPEEIQDVEFINIKIESLMKKESSISLIVNNPNYVEPTKEEKEIKTTNPDTTQTPTTTEITPENAGEIENPEGTSEQLEKDLEQMSTSLE